MPTTYSPWECSSSFEQFYAQQRDHTAKLLGSWGVLSSNHWPDRAMISRPPALVRMQPGWFNQIIAIGLRGVRHTIAFDDLPPEVRDVVLPEKAALTETYFIENAPGRSLTRPPTAMAYLPLAHHVCVVHLGCQHDTAYTVAQPIATLTRWHCPICAYTWEVDHGD